MSINNQQYPVTVEVLNTVCSSLGRVLKMVLFERNDGPQALVQVRIRMIGRSWFMVVTESCGRL